MGEFEKGSSVFVNRIQKFLSFNDKKQLLNRIIIRLNILK